MVSTAAVQAPARRRSPTGKILRGGALLLSVLLCGCPPQKKSSPKAARPANAAAKARSAAPAKPVDPVAQKQAYERGLTLYGEEKYAEAQKAWQESVRMGPNTPLGKKSQEYLQKVGSILQNLKEMDQP